MDAAVSLLLAQLKRLPDRTALPKLRQHCLDLAEQCELELQTSWLHRLPRDLRLNILVATGESTALAQLGCTARAFSRTLIVKAEGKIALTLHGDGLAQLRPHQRSAPYRLFWLEQAKQAAVAWQRGGYEDGALIEGFRGEGYTLMPDHVMSEVNSRAAAYLMAVVRFSEHPVKPERYQKHHECSEYKAHVARTQVVERLDGRHAAVLLPQLHDGAALWLAELMEREESMPATTDSEMQSLQTVDAAKKLIRLDTTAERQYIHIDWQHESSYLALIRALHRRLPTNKAVSDCLIMIYERCDEIALSERIAALLAMSADTDLKERCVSGLLTVVPLHRHGDRRSGREWNEKTLIDALGKVRVVLGQQHVVAFHAVFACIKTMLSDGNPQKAARMVKIELRRFAKSGFFSCDQETYSSHADIAMNTLSDIAIAFKETSLPVSELKVELQGLVRVAQDSSLCIETSSEQYFQSLAYARMLQPLVQVLEDCDELAAAEREQRQVVSLWTLVQERYILRSRERSSQDCFYVEQFEATIRLYKLLARRGKTEDAAGLTDTLVEYYVKLITDMWTGHFVRSYVDAFPLAGYKNESELSTWNKVYDQLEDLLGSDVREMAEDCCQAAAESVVQQSGGHSHEALLVRCRLAYLLLKHAKDKQCIALLQTVVQDCGVALHHGQDHTANDDQSNDLSSATRGLYKLLKHGSDIRELHSFELKMAQVDEKEDKPLSYLTRVYVLVEQGELAAAHVLCSKMLQLAQRGMYGPFNQHMSALTNGVRVLRQVAERMARVLQLENQHHEAEKLLQQVIQFTIEPEEKYDDCANAIVHERVQTALASSVGLQGRHDEAIQLHRDLLGELKSIDKTDIFFGHEIDNAVIRSSCECALWLYEATYACNDEEVHKLLAEEALDLLKHAKQLDWDGRLRADRLTALIYKKHLPSGMSVTDLDQLEEALYIRLAIQDDEENAEDDVELEENARPCKMQRT